MSKLQPIVSPVLSRISYHNGKAEVDVEAGKVQEVVLERRFSLLSAIATGITTGNTWAALGGAIAASLYNGGPAGVLYEFIVVSVMYWFIGLSIAELASAIPASGGVYHWAFATAGERWGRVVSWYAGWLNYFAWTFGISSTCAIIGQIVIYSYGLFHADFVVARWQVFVVYLVVCWSTCAIVMFGTVALPAINKAGSFFILAGFFVTIITCAVMPSRNGMGYASNAFVWKDWTNDTGYESNGFVFLAGMLNGAFAVGTPDCVTHIAEEIPDAARNLPKVLFCQVFIGFITAVCFLVTLFYSINDLDAILAAGSIFPLGDIYLQATGSRGGALGLLVVIAIPVYVVVIGCYITAGRTLYVLARDNAAPFPGHLGSISTSFKSPLWATFACGLVCTCMGAIYVGSLSAFNAFVGSFVLLTTLSFLLAIGPNLLRNRKAITPGPFSLGKAGYVVNAVSCVYIIVFFVIYCFPYALPTTAEAMNYTSVITMGLAFLVTVWWFVHGRTHYQGPSMVTFEEMEAESMTD